MSSDPNQAVGDEPALAWRGDQGTATGRTTWSEHVAAHRARTTPTRRWAAIVLAAVVGGPFAVVGALLSPLTGAASLAFVLTVVVLAPAAEEILKAAGATYLAEQRPWLVPTAWSLVLATLVSGLVFAAIENVIYLSVYIEDPSPEIARFRWIAGPLVHGGASTLAGIGAARTWSDGLPPTALRRPRSTPWIVAAIVVHGVFNGAVTLLSALGRWVPTG